MDLGYTYRSNPRKYMMQRNRSRNSNAITRTRNTTTLNRRHRIRKPSVKQNNEHFHDDWREPGNTSPPPPPPNSSRRHRSRHRSASPVLKKRVDRRRRKGKKKHGHRRRHHRRSVSEEQNEVVVGEDERREDEEDRQKLHHHPNTLFIPGNQTQNRASGTFLPRIAQQQNIVVNVTTPWRYTRLGDVVMVRGTLELTINEQCQEGTTTFDVTGLPVRQNAFLGYRYTQSFLSGFIREMHRSYQVFGVSCGGTKNIRCYFDLDEAILSKGNRTVVVILNGCYDV